MYVCMYVCNFLYLPFEWYVNEKSHLLHLNTQFFSEVQQGLLNNSVLKLLHMNCWQTINRTDILDVGEPTLDGRRNNRLPDDPTYVTQEKHLYRHIFVYPQILE